MGVKIRQLGARWVDKTAYKLRPGEKYVKREGEYVINGAGLHKVVLPDWYVVVHSKGKQVTTKVGTEKEADRIASQMRIKLKQDETYLSHIVDRVDTFAEYAEKWAAIPSNRHPGTTDMYRTALNKHILPQIGGMPIDQIKRKHLKELYDKMR